MKRSSLYILLLSYLFSNIVNAQHDTTTGFDFIVANDGVWTWFNDERAAFKNDKLYTSYVKSDGKVGLSVNNIKTGVAIGSEVILSEFSEVDDHNNAAILMRQDGKIMAFYSRHITERKNHYRTSLVDEPTSQADWSAQITQNAGNGPSPKAATYNNTYQLSAENGVIYTFMRTNNFNPNVKAYNSDGTPLLSGQDYILFNIGNNGSIRPYVKYASNDTDRIDFFLTDGHPRNEENNLYHCYYQTNSNGTRGNIYHSDGTLIASLQSVLDGTPIEVSQLRKVYAFGSDGTMDRPWTHSINYDASGNPVVTYSQQKDFNNINYHYAYWDGTAWVNKFVTDAGRGVYNQEQDYTGIITTNPYNTNEIFMSSNRNPISGVENTRYEIYSAITANGGDSWTWTEVTSNSAQDNLRPFVPKGITTVEDRVVLWFHGRYTTFIDYRTRVVGEYINKVYNGPAPVIVDIEPNPTPPIDTNITYGVDIDGRGNNGAGAEGPTLSPFVRLSATAGATATDNGVTFTIFGTVSGSRDRGTGSPNDLVRDFVFGNGDGTSTGVRIDGLPAGEYQVNSFHYDNDFSAPVSVILREQGKPQIGNAIAINNLETPASFTLTAEANKVYEIVATGTTGRGSRFNGVSIIDANTPPPTAETVKLDVNTGTSQTKTGYTGILGTNNTTVTTANGSYLLFGFNPQPGTNSNSDNLLNDFAQNSGAAGATPAIGLRMTGLAAGTYNITSWHYDPSVSTRNIKVQTREAGFGNPQTELISNVSLGSTAGVNYQITVEAGKNYDLIFRASDNDATATQARLNGIEITPASVLSVVGFQKGKTTSTFKVYPNPFKDEFTLDLINTNATNIKVFSTHGTIVAEQNIKNESSRVVLENTPSGLYFIVLYNNQKIISSQKIIKK